VTTLGSNEFPAFFARSSGFKVNSIKKDKERKNKNCRNGGMALRLKTLKKPLNSIIHSPP